MFLSPLIKYFFQEIFKKTWFQTVFCVPRYRIRYSLRSSHKKYHISLDFSELLRWRGLQIYKTLKTEPAWHYYGPPKIKSKLTNLLCQNSGPPQTQSSEIAYKWERLFSCRLLYPEHNIIHFKNETLGISGVNKVRVKSLNTNYNPLALLFPTN